MYLHALSLLANHSAEVKTNPSFRLAYVSSLLPLQTAESQR